jgi:hypothetical protein
MREFVGPTALLNSKKYLEKSRGKPSTKQANFHKNMDFGGLDWALELR